jgi:hypothetical protein
VISPEALKIFLKREMRKHSAKELARFEIGEVTKEATVMPNALPFSGGAKRLPLQRLVGQLGS